MPNSLTHSYIGDIILESLDDKYKKIILKNKKAYKLGTFGPDILMGLVLEKEPLLRDAGDRLHEDSVFAGICNMAAYLREHFDEQLYSYFMGYLTHYAADSTIHPYVYDYVENRLDRKFDPKLSACIHGIVETEMDTYIGHKFLKGKKANSFYLYSVSRKLRKLIYRFYLDINKDMFQLCLNKRDILKSCFMCKLMMLICHRHKNGRLRFMLVNRIDRLFKADHVLISILRPRNLDTRHDYLNMKKLPFPTIHKSKNSPLVNYTFPEMIQIAKIRGLEYIEKVSESIFKGSFLDLSDFELSFNGAMNIEYAQGIKENLIEEREQTSLIPEGFKALTEDDLQEIIKRLDEELNFEDNNSQTAADEIDNGIDNPDNKEGINE